MKKRYLFAGLFVILWLINQKPYIFILIPDLIWTLILTKKIETRSKGDSLLKKDEKIQVIITELFVPILAGMFYYYCLKNQFPLKAKQVGKYNWIIFFIELVIVVVIIALSFLPLLSSKY